LAAIATTKKIQRSNEKHFISTVPLRTE
jgi:hypothetical protein